MKTKLCTLAFVLALTGTAAASAFPPVAAPDDDSSYAAGTRAMNESRWQDAITSFDQVVDAHGKKADAALYWKAYALNKLSKPQLAMDTCMKLRVDYKTSPWNKDCSALQLNNTITWTRADSSNMYQYDFDFANPSARSKDPDTDLKMLALNSLANRDPAQAMPILRNILTGTQSPDLKQHALFVLSQSRSPEAQAMLHDIILGKQGPALQRQAIQASGIYLGRRSNDLLAEVYKTTTDPQIKKTIISAFFISGDDTRMVELARAEKDISLKRTIVSQLSLMQGKAATDYMMELLK